MRLYPEPRPSRRGRPRNDVPRSAKTKSVRLKSRPKFVSSGRMHITTREAMTCGRPRHKPLNAMPRTTMPREPGSKALWPRDLTSVPRPMAPSEPRSHVPRPAEKHRPIHHPSDHTGRPRNHPATTVLITTRPDCPADRPDRPSERRGRPEAVFEAQSAQFKPKAGADLARLGFFHIKVLTRQCRSKVNNAMQHHVSTASRQHRDSIGIAAHHRAGEKTLKKVNQGSKMGLPPDDPNTGLQSELGADGNPIVHPVEVDATNGHQQALTSRRTATRPKVAKLHRDLNAISSKVHGATSSTPDYTEILADTQKIGDSKTVTSISSMEEASIPSRRCLQNRYHLKNARPQPVSSKHDPEKTSVVKARPQPVSSKHDPEKTSVAKARPQPVSSKHDPVKTIVAEARPQPVSSKHDPEKTSVAKAQLMAGLDCLKFSQFINPTNELQVHSRVVVGVEHEEEVFSLNTL
ncbi:unnamed protein product [Microthlaspi erraticum]|uniref:Uncharacterized protein n=1 Tax=Microthlaspi erraticum TaxID=1685480 RepID=A0A6D2JJ99_9BRAS|nr:unnamed protein product [Microthlaspi erraticum]